LKKPVNNAASFVLVLLQNAKRLVSDKAVLVYVGLCINNGRFRGSKVSACKKNKLGSSSGLHFFKKLLCRANQLVFQGRTGFQGLDFQMSF